MTDAFGRIGSLMVPEIPGVPGSSSPALHGDALRRELDRKDPVEAAHQMEALFATMLVKELRRALPNGFFGDGTGADTFNGWLDEHFGGALAESGALDLAGMIRTSLENGRDAKEGAGESALKETPR